MVNSAFRAANGEAGRAGGAGLAQSNPLASLTEREFDVLGAMAAGASNDGIAERLWISVKTVEAISRAIFLKLGLGDGDAGENRRVKAVLMFIAHDGLSEGAPPAPSTPFVGHVALVGAVVDQLAESRCVSLVGLGGTGKTRVAIEVAVRHRDSGGQVRFVALAGGGRRRPARRRRRPAAVTPTAVAICVSGNRVAGEWGCCQAGWVSERALATIETISQVGPIDGADAIERAQVRGWTVVVRKDQFRAGDRCVYLEIDSFLPVQEGSPFAFLAPRGVRTMSVGGEDRQGHALRTAKLRGVISQGLVLPLEEVAGLVDVDEVLGADVTERLGIIKWEPPLPASGQGDAIGVFPSYLASKTDAERVQNLGDDVLRVLRSACTWVATEKIDGTSMTVGRDADGDLVVAGRNWRIGDGANLYWDAVRANRLDELVGPGEAIQVEVYGEGIQANPLKVRGQHVAIFAMWRDRALVARSDWPRSVAALAAPQIPDLELAVTVADVIAQVDAIRSVISPKSLAEGVVWHAADGRTFPELDGRACFKAISNTWLLKHG